MATMRWRRCRTPSSLERAIRPEAAVDALHVIEAEATRALAEMRSMVRVLQTEETATTVPMPRQQVRR